MMMPSDAQAKRPFDALQGDPLRHDLLFPDGRLSRRSHGADGPERADLGHSKDHRPDLKAIMVGVTKDTEGCLLAGTMLYGC